MIAARRAVCLALVLAGISLGLLLYATPRLAIVPLIAAVLAIAAGLELLRAHLTNQGKPRS